MRHAFDLCDTDRSGTISAAELFNVMNNVLGENMTMEEVKAMVEEADTNGSGEIDYAEFAKIMATLSGK